MSRPTIKDIASRAGVSIATVSYVINRSRNVSPELTERVERAIEELGYYPDENARSLRSKRTKMIGLIVPDNANPFFAEIAKGVEDAGFAEGYTVILCNSNRMPERELSYLDVLQSKRVDGLILAPTTATVDQIRPIIEQDTPAVVFYRSAGDLDLDTFTIDNYVGGYMATEHLLNLGHSQIACIRPASAKTTSAQRVAGYKQALKDHGFPIDPVLMPQGNNLVSGGRLATQELLASDVSFSALFATNDAMAIGAVGALHEAGCRVPQDISVIGFDDIALASHVNPPLTTIAQPKESAGKLAVEYLIERLEGKHTSGRREVVLDLELVIRASTSRKE